MRDPLRTGAEGVEIEVERDLSERVGAVVL